MSRCKRNNSKMRGASDDVITSHNQMALESFSIFLSEPSKWKEMTSLAVPTYLPPMKTAGTAWLEPNVLKRARSISRPCGSLSSSWIAGLAPSS